MDNTHPSQKRDRSPETPLDAQITKRRHHSESRHMDPSLFLLRPMDDTALGVHRFLSASLDRAEAQLPLLPTGTTIEIEGKLGCIVEKRSGNRVQLPIASEAIFGFSTSHSFESNMSMAQHGLFNQMLNRLIKPDSKTRYLHTKQRDEIFNQHLRVSYNETNGEMIGAIKKQRISDLEILSPNSPFDYRISVNLEIPVTEIPNVDEKIPHSIRKKDRMSYTHEAFQVDLTQVKQTRAKGECDTMHELEIEVRDMPRLLESREQNKHGLVPFVEILLNTLRNLNRMGKNV